MNFQLLDSNLQVIKEFETFSSLLAYTDTLPNMGRGMYYFSKRAKKAFQLV